MSDLQQLVKNMIGNTIASQYFCLPAKVASYNNTKRQASVEPGVRKVTRNGTVLDIPIVVNVPVVFPGNENMGLSFRVQKGDTVLLIFSDRSLDEWLESGNTVTPNSKRRFSLTDAIAIPGLMPFVVDSGATADGLQLKNKNTKVKLLDSGNLVLETGNTTITLDGSKVVINVGSTGQQLELDGTTIKLNAGTAGKIALGTQAAELITILITVLTALAAEPTLASTAVYSTANTQLATIKGIL